MASAPAVSHYAEFRSMADAINAMNVFVKEGERVSPRGKDTFEIRPFIMKLINPRSRLAYLPGRKFNLMFAIAEAIRLFDDDSALMPIAWFNERMSEFSDNGHTLYGAYGPRIREHLGSVVEKLNNDKDSRQAVLSVYKSDDIHSQSKDIPCTLTLHFLVRDGKLELMCNMRSNDFFIGFVYDVFQFTVLQEVIANELGIEVGPYTHSANSMHLYETDLPKVEDAGVYREIEMPALPYAVGDMYRMVRELQTMTSFNQAPDLRLGSFMSLIWNEYNHKKTEPNRNLPRDVPEWASQFVKRWGANVIR